MAGISDIFGKGSIGEQLLVWGVLNQVIGELIDPGVTELSYLVNETVPIKVLSPAELATLVNRGFVAEGDAATDAAKAGIETNRFHQLVDLAGDAPGPEQLVEALRRGIIALDAATGDIPSFNDGIRQGNMRDVWAPFFQQLAVELPSWSDALDALLEGQLDQATAMEWYVKAGGDPDAFTWLFDTRGSSPTPDMLGTMANRGVIPWGGTGPDVTSFDQGFLEGPWRNKWEPAMKALQVYLPPPRTVTALLHDGQITEAQAVALLKQHGLPADLAAAYVKPGTTAIATTAQHLSASQVETLYEDHLVTSTEARSMLTALGYTSTEASLSITLADTKRAIANTNAAITRVRTSYLALKIDAGQASAALVALGVDSGQASQLIATWDIENKATFHPLTATVIADAFAYAAIDQDEAMAELAGLGYTPYDAWILLAVASKGVIPNKPAKTAGPT